MLHTLSNTFLFPQPQLLLPPTRDEEGKVAASGRARAALGPAATAGHRQDSREPGRPGGCASSGRWAAGGVALLVSGFGVSPGRNWRVCVCVQECAPASEHP